MWGLQYLRPPQRMTPKVGRKVWYCRKELLKSQSWSVQEWKAVSLLVRKVFGSGRHLVRNVCLEDPELGETWIPLLLGLDPSGYTPIIFLNFDLVVCKIRIILIT